MRRILSFAAVVVAAVALLLTPSANVYAQSNGLGITPRKDVTVTAGKSVTDKLYINNLNGNEALSLSLQIVDFGSKDETGTPALNLDPNAKQTAWSLKPFIKAPESITVAAGKSEYVNYSITVPEGQGAGSYYSAIRYVAQGADGTSNVTVSASGATLVFLTVPGKTKESLLVKDFGAYATDKGKETGKYRSLFVKSQPQEIALTLKNQGNVAEQPNGNILVKNMFGKSVKVIKDANPRRSLALIDQTRLFKSCFNQKEQKSSNSEIVCQDAGLAPGRYTIQLSAFYGINGNQSQEIVTSATFWYLPVWFLVAVGVSILAIAGGIYYLYRRITGRNGFKRR